MLTSCALQYRNSNCRTSGFFTVIISWNIMPFTYPMWKCLRARKWACKGHVARASCKSVPHTPLKSVEPTSVSLKWEFFRVGAPATRAHEVCHDSSFLFFTVSPWCVPSTTQHFTLCGFPQSGWGHSHGKSSSSSMGKAVIAA